jgi:hypothetical protein
MSPREVFDRHLRHLLEGDMDAILADYAPDAVAADPDGIGWGHDHIRESYERTLPRSSRRGDELVGVDTFVIRDGLIHVHTFYATTASPTRCPSLQSPPPGPVSSSTSTRRTSAGAADPVEAGAVPAQ